MLLWSKLLTINVQFQIVNNQKLIMIPKWINKYDIILYLFYCLEIVFWLGFLQSSVNVGSDGSFLFQIEYKAI